MPFTGGRHVGSNVLMCPGTDQKFYDQTVQMVEEVTNGIPDGSIPSTL